MAESGIVMRGFSVQRAVVSAEMTVGPVVVNDYRIGIVQSSESEYALEITRGGVVQTLRIVSPVIRIERIDGGHRVMVTDAEGVKTFVVADGAAGSGNGSGGGVDGGYYEPSVDGNGVLSWTASRAGMPAVAAVNIAGPQGADGYTPVRGTDYWTEADIADIHDYIDQNMPDGADITVDQTVTAAGTNPVSGDAVAKYVAQEIGRIADFEGMVF